MTGPSYSRASERDIFLISDDDRRGREAYRFLRDENVPVSEPCRVEDASLQAPGAPVWVELIGGEEKVEHWLGSLGDALAGVPATVVIPERMLDVAAARLDGADIEILVDPDAKDRLAALALMRARNAALRSSSHEDVGEDVDLLHLSQEVARISASLATLTRKNDFSTPSSPPHARPAAPIDAALVRQHKRARELRKKFVDPQLLSDPAWDMLVDLTEADLINQRVPVSSLCLAAGVPATTALRWIRTMTKRGLFVRVPDKSDGRRVFIELADDTRAAMHAYFDAVRGQAAA